MLGGSIVLHRFGLAEYWGTVWTNTVLLGVALLVFTVGETRRRSRQLLRKWPLVAAVVLFFIDIGSSLHGCSATGSPLGYATVLCCYGR